MLGVCICDTWFWWVLSRSALPNSKTETLKSQNLKKTRHRRDMERRLKWKGTNDGGIQLHRADVLLSFFSRTGRLFFPTPPPQYYYSSHLLCWSYHPPFPLSVLSSVYLSHRSDVLYLTFPIRSFVSSPFYIPSVRPSIRYFQANILHFGNARLALFNVPNVLTISVCIYLFEYADGRSSNVGLRQQRPPTFTRESSADVQSLLLVPLGETGTSLWYELYTLP